MNPKEKAKELVESFMEVICPDGGALSYKRQQWERAKQCAIICVKEILGVLQKNSNGLIYSEYPAIFEDITYYQQVKIEIELL